MAAGTNRQTPEESLILGRKTGAIPMLPVKPRVVARSEAFEILAGRDVHEEEMEELVVGLIAVQAEFHQCALSP